MSGRASEQAAAGSKGRLGEYVHRQRRWSVGFPPNKNGNVEDAE